MVLCACNNKQMYGIRSVVKELDPNAFVIIMESNEVLGKDLSLINRFTSFLFILNAHQCQPPGRSCRTGSFSVSGL